MPEQPDFEARLFFVWKNWAKIWYTQGRAHPYPPVARIDLKMSRQTSLTKSADQATLLTEWETGAKNYFGAGRALITGMNQLPPELPLAAGVHLFLETLKGQSQETAKTYRVGCRRFMWFIFKTTGQPPDQATIYELSPLVLEDFYLWLVATYGRKARATCNSYMAATRNLFDYLARRRLTPGGCQYQEMIAGLGRLQGRASYKTPRVKGRQVAQAARLALKPAVPALEDLAAAELEAGSADATPFYPEGAAPAPEVLPLLNPGPAGDFPRNFAEDHPGELLDTSLTVTGNLLKRLPRSQPEKDRRDLEELRDRAIILTLYCTGMRRQELASLDRRDLEALLDDYRRDLFRAYQATVTGRGEGPANGPTYELIITGKGQKERLVYFDQVTLAAIEEYLTRRGKDGFRPLFLQHHRGRDKVKPISGGENYRVSLVTVWQVVARYAARLGVDLKPHDFRHNLATSLLNAGAQLSEVQDILGHASPTTTKQIYAHYDKGHLREAFSKYRKSAADLEPD